MGLCERGISIQTLIAYNLAVYFSVDRYTAEQKLSLVAHAHHPSTQKAKPEDQLPWLHIEFQPDLTRT